MICDSLRKSVLQAAIQGKLTKQLESDGNANDLLSTISAKRESLLRDRTIRRKSTPSSVNDDVPFDLPANWKWCRFGDVVNIVSARRVHQTDWRRKGIPFYRAREIAKLAQCGHVDNELFISRELFDEFSKSGVPHAGDLMVTSVGTLGQTYIVKDTDVFYYKDASVTCLETYASLDPQFVKYYMESPTMAVQITGNSGGTTVATLTIERMNEYLFPLPPLAEQHRIAARVDELMAKIDDLQLVENELETMKKVFPSDMKKALLMQAIQGKLTKQPESDGDANELLASIEKERRRLTKGKKIRKEDQIHPVSADEIPFDIPDNWVWTRLGTISTYGTSRGKVKSAQVSAKTWALDLEDIEKGTSRILVRKTVADRKIDGEKSVFCKGNILYSKLRPYLLKVLIAPEDGICTPELVPFDVLKCDAAYFVSVLKSPYVDTSINAVTYGMKMPRVGTDTMLSLPVPLPPLAEQHRIVARVDELMARIDELQILGNQLEP